MNRKDKILNAGAFLGIIFFALVSIIAYGSEGGAIFGLGVISGAGLLAIIINIIKDRYGGIPISKYKNPCK